MFTPKIPEKNFYMVINKKQKVSLIIGLAVILAAVIIWLADGTYVFTQTKVLIEKKDPLFGTTYKVWQNKFIWGLDLTLVVTAVSIILSGLFFFIFKNKRKSINEIHN